MQLVTNRNSQSGPIAASDSGRVSALPPPRHSADEVLLWNVKEVALALGLGVRTVWRLSSSEQLPTPISVGRCKRWERRAIEAYVAAALVRADASDDPPAAARYPRRQRLRQLIRLIQHLPRDENGAVTLAQQPLAELLGVSRVFVGNMIRSLIADGLLVRHTPPSRADGRAATYIWRSKA